MREIKFRAWHHGEMLTQAIDTPYGVSRLFGFLDANGEHSFDKVMQWTGLQDSKGVDIYESDIVEHSDTKGFPSLSIGVIEWDEYRAQFSHSRYSEEYLSGKVLTVIGNIYEDKDLIK